MAKTIAIIGTLGTKGDEFMFVKKEVEKRGHTALVINAGILGSTALEPDGPAEDVARAACKVWWAQPTLRCGITTNPAF